MIAKLMVNEVPGWVLRSLGMQPRSVMGVVVVLPGIANTVLPDVRLA